MKKESPVWGLMLLPVFFAWVLVMRIVFVLMGFNPGEYAGFRGWLVLIFATVWTIATVVTAYENSPTKD